ncbi:zinc finger protein with KRAB and SCAN domains 8 isoform X1 [Prionailurus iriomotensis]
MNVEEVSVTAFTVTLTTGCTYGKNGLQSIWEMFQSSYSSLKKCISFGSEFICMPSTWQSL